MPGKNPPAEGTRHRQIHNLLRSRLNNVILMVPATDWAKVTLGEKRMFRSYSRRLRPTLLPTPAVAYHFLVGDRVEHTPIWLEDTWREPLGSITAEDLAEEGFDSLSAFRRYFAERYPKGGYRPLTEVQVYRVRPITEDDYAEYTERLLKHLRYR